MIYSLEKISMDNLYAAELWKGKVINLYMNITNTTSVRNYKFDNIKCLLMFLVLFGHSLELFKGDERKLIYQIIYLFHMPAFIFMTGYFAKYQPKKILQRYVITYFVFQTLYQIFDAVVLEETLELSLQYTKPYWHLWFLMAAGMYLAMIPFINTEKKKYQVAMILIAILISLLAGYDKTIGYTLTLSRFMTFMPFFTIGYFCSKYKHLGEHTINQNQKRIIGIGSVVICVISMYWLKSENIKTIILYGSVNYEKASYHMGIRGLLLIFAMAWIIALLFLIPNRKIPVISISGQHTFWVFILQGFILRLEKKYQVYQYSQGMNLLLAAVSSFAILFVLSYPWKKKIKQRKDMSA